MTGALPPSQHRVIHEQPDVVNALIRKFIVD